MTSRPSGLGAEASTSSQRQARNQSTSLGQDIVNIQLECAYPPAIEAKDSETGTVAEKMSREIAASERKQYPWD